MDWNATASICDMAMTMKMKNVKVTVEHFYVSLT